MNKIILCRNGEETVVSNIPGLSVEWLGDNAIFKCAVDCTFARCIVQIGSNSHIFFDEKSRIRNLFIRCASTNSICKFGKRFISEGGKIVLPNGHDKQSLIVGDHCLFSNDIFIQTADGHSIIDKFDNVLNDNGVVGGNRVEIGDHVWLGYHVCILRNGRIGNNVVVGACSVVTKAFSRPNCILAGNPAKIIKTNVNWKIESPQYIKEGSQND